MCRSWTALLREALGLTSHVPRLEGFWLLRQHGEKAKSPFQSLPSLEGFGDVLNSDQGLIKLHCRVCGLHFVLPELLDAWAKDARAARRPITKLVREWEFEGGLGTPAGTGEDALFLGACG